MEKWPSLNDSEFNEKLKNNQITHADAMMHIYQLVFVNDYLSRPRHPIYSSIILSEIIARLSKVMMPEIMRDKIMKGMNVKT